MLTIAAWMIGLALASAAVPQPGLKFYPRRIEIKRIWDDQTTNMAVTISNSLGQAVYIKEAVPSCHCTVAVLEQGVLSPGGTSRMVITYSPRGQGGLIERTVTLRTDRGDANWVFTAGVQPRIEVFPRALQFHLVEGQSARTNVQITYHGTGKWAPNSLGLLPGMRGQVRAENKNRFNLELSILPTAMESVDWRDQHLIIAGQGSAAYTRVGVNGSRRRWLKVTPDTLNFGALSRSITNTASVTIRDTFLRSAFRTLGVRSPRSWIHCRLCDLHEGAYRLTAEIAFPPPEQRGFFDEPIEVRTNDPHRPVLSISAIGLNTGK